MPSVCGRAWNINASGAPAIKMIVTATRMTNPINTATIIPTSSTATKIRK